MIIKLIVSQNCDARKRAEKTLLTIKTKKTNLYYEIIDVNSFKEKNISITPALLVDNKIVSYGDIDVQKLYKIIS